jgi:hypothetical protein
MYIYIFIYAYEYMYIYVCMYIYVYVDICIHIFTLCKSDNLFVQIYIDMIYVQTYENTKKYLYVY